MRAELSEEHGKKIRCHGLIGSAIRCARYVSREPQYFRMHWRDISTLHLQDGSHRSSLSAEIMVNTRVQANLPLWFAVVFLGPRKSNARSGSLAGTHQHSLLH
jgi:hypothetical protein